MRGREPYGDGDIDAWAEMRSPDDLRALMSTRRLLVAEGRKGMAAYSVLDIEAATLRSVYVHPDAQGCGLGRRLVADAIAAARRARLVRLELDAAPTSATFYESLGFAALGETEHRFRGGSSMTCVRMARDLSAGGDD